MILTVKARSLKKCKTWTLRAVKLRHSDNRFLAGEQRLLIASAFATSRRPIVSDRFRCVSEDKRTLLLNGIREGKEANRWSLLFFALVFRWLKPAWQEYQMTQQLNPSSVSGCCCCCWRCVWRDRSVLLVKQLLAVFSLLALKTFFDLNSCQNASSAW